MLNIFRNNQFFVAIPLLLYIIVLHAGALLGYIAPAPHPEEGGLLYRAWFGWTAHSPLWSAVISVALTFIQAVYLNFLADHFRLLGERNWFPGLFYALIASALPEFLFVSPVLAAVTFVGPGLWSIFNAYQKPMVGTSIFDAGFWLAVGSLFYAPLLWLSIAAFAGIGVVRAFRLNERFVFLSGTFIPLFLTWLWYFWEDKGGAFRDAQAGAQFQWYRFDVGFDQQMLLKSGLLLLLGLVFLFGFGSLFSRKVIQIQKYISVLYWFLVVGALSALFRFEWRWEHLLLPAAAMGLLLALTFQNFRSRFWAEITHLSIVAPALLIQYWDLISGLLSF